MPWLLLLGSPLVFAVQDASGQPFQGGGGLQSFSPISDGFSSIALNLVCLPPNHGDSPPSSLPVPSQHKSKGPARRFPILWARLIQSIRTNPQQNPCGGMLGGACTCHNTHVEVRGQELVLSFTVWLQGIELAAASLGASTSSYLLSHLQPPSHSPFPLSPSPSPVLALSLFPSCSLNLYQRPHFCSLTQAVIIQIQPAILNRSEPPWFSSVRRHSEHSSCVFLGQPPRLPRHSMMTVQSLVQGFLTLLPDRLLVLYS